MNTKQCHMDNVTKINLVDDKLNTINIKFIIPRMKLVSLTMALKKPLPLIKGSLPNSIRSSLIFPFVEFFQQHFLLLIIK